MPRHHCKRLRPGSVAFFLSSPFWPYVAWGLLQSGLNCGSESDSSLSRSWTLLFRRSFVGVSQTMFLWHVFAWKNQTVWRSTYSPSVSACFTWPSTTY
ncbi:hypothetical protein F5X68DRAFT_208729 [Plectosphaerella plurivora]|uniref:Uncharacterized protein n=1 Tax=Plectosphaerella plurivora TaxID=936078 RepID=A0A9P9A7Z8_9PEZI|nr:hypothetical protein F5X68DRAFT_208729 [Plectosphaerella plurivora]